MPPRFKKKYCPCCGSGNIKYAFSLESTPLEDSFQKNKKKNKYDKLISLKLLFCKSCTNLFLDYFINPNISYKNYLYNTSNTKGLSNHYDDYAKYIKRKYFKNSTNFKILDLGSNDGSLLNSFKKNGFKVLGIEPAKDQAYIANQLKLKTINAYFDYKITRKIKKTFGLVDIVSANYMLANVNHLKKFMKNISRVIKKDGLLVIQTGYHPLQFKKLMFDYIYHEHFNYFTVKSLLRILSFINFKIIDVDVNHFKGSSLRVMATNKSNENFKINNKKINKLINLENVLKLNNRIYYDKFIKKVNYQKIVVNKFLSKQQGKKVYGFGASHSTTTLIHHFNLEKYLSYIIDDNKLKSSTFSPYFKIPVIHTSLLSKYKPDIIVILAWQHKENILKQNAKIFKKLNIKVFDIIPKVLIN